MIPLTNNTTQPRRGLVIVPALVTLVIVTAFCGILMSQLASQRKTVRAEERRMQADWLAEAGLARARARLAVDRAFRGETWVIPPAELDGQTGAVVIVVEPVPNQPARRRVRIDATYPRDGDYRAHSSRAIEFTPRPERTGEPT